MKDFLDSNFWIIQSIILLYGIIVTGKMGLEDLKERVFNFFTIITIVTVMLWTVFLIVIVYHNITRLLIK